MEKMSLGEMGGIDESGSALYRHDTPARNASESDPVSEKYSDLTEDGVEHAQEVARIDILKTIEGAQEGSVLFIGGKSDQLRAGQTAEIWGEALGEIAKERQDIIVLTKEQIDQKRNQIKDEHSGGKILNEINKIIAENPDKKIVVDYPLQISQFSYGYEDRWTRKVEDPNNPGRTKTAKTEYFSEILKKHHNNHAESIHDWLQNDGVLTTTDGRTIQGPRPEDVAKQYLQGLERLQQFVKKQIPDRTILVHGVGHQWDLDAVATYLARGKVSYDDWYEVMGRPDADKEEQVIGEGEGVQDIAIDSQTGKMSVEYRGNKFVFNNENMPALSSKSWHVLLFLLGSIENYFQFSNKL